MNDINKPNINNNPPANNPNNVQEELIDGVIKTRVTSRHSSRDSDSRIINEPDDSLKPNDILTLDDPYYTINLDRSNELSESDAEDNPEQADIVGSPISQNIDEGTE